jgi:hypothetical protein
MSSYSVAIQGFYNDVGEIVVKEIAVVHVETEHLVQHLVMRLPPTFFSSLPEKFERSNRWLSDVFHGMSWCSGFASPSDIRIPDGIVYVKGRQIQNLVLKLNKNTSVVNVEDLGCPGKVENLPTGTSSCEWHRFETKKCALVTAKALARWVRDSVH